MGVQRIACPTCGVEVVWGEGAPHRPFCSERCRLIDLGEWFGEGRRIPEDGGAVPGESEGEDWQGAG